MGAAISRLRAVAHRQLDVKRVGHNKSCCPTASLVKIRRYSVIFIEYVSFTMTNLFQVKGPAGHFSPSQKPCVATTINACAYEKVITVKTTPTNYAFCWSGHPARPGFTHAPFEQDATHFRRSYYSIKRSYIIDVKTDLLSVN